VLPNKSIKITARTTEPSFTLPENEEMESNFAKLAIASTLAVAIASTARAQEQNDAPKDNKVVRYAMPILRPLQPAAEWTGIVTDPTLKAAAPEADHVVADAATWEKLWGTWNANTPLPEDNFEKDMLFVFTALGHNVPSAKLHRIGGHVNGRVYRTVIGGPGFGYRIIKVPRKGITDFFGQPIKSGA
jgi:hypothetical protein